jgi:SulP family sulfate permease
MKAFLFLKIKENWRAGLTVSLVSIPLAVSLAVASNASPVAGVITAVWAGFIAALFGGSNFNIIGPTGALSGILATYSLMYGVGALPTLAILTGLFILVAYLFKLERYLIYFPASTMHGFTLGVAFIIILNQLNYMLGLSGLPQHHRFLSNVLESFRHMSDASVATFLIFLLFLMALFILVKIMPNVPGAIVLAPVAILLGYLSSKGFISLSIQTLETRYPTLSGAFFSFPKFCFSHALVVPAIAIAIVAILETMISARIADGVTKTKHNKRKEMFGLGIANIASGLAGGIPATAALARTALNIKSGGKHKVSAALNSLFILIISLCFISFFKYIPLTAIAAMLVFVSVKMIEHEHFVRMFRIDKKNFFISLAVAGVTIYEDPIVGLLLGATVAMLMFMERISKGSYELTSHEDFLKKYTPSGDVIVAKDVPTLIYTIKGTLAYINAQAHIARFEKRPINELAVILDLKELYFIDHDGIEAFGEIIEILQRSNKIILLTGVSPFIEQMLSESKDFVLLKEKGLAFPSIAHALNYLS